MTSHAWQPSVRAGTPVLRCRNTGCKVVWWPGRNEPKSACKGAPVDPAETVRALIVGGAV
ncbi:hypothetical protein ACFFX1_55425 [Dactylosporangium sucinum]|uniref:Uncharacterized protein n=1 Tax=Dactylosporangium sucinum TaxID=1424081 RepID=A0A917X055_9ACTN|nr:hypothetical protein [Dactylosporangium sucinum]GGM52653.1 hypothetical protein GCM10007977_062790 [Dactylosporangium sucinum]